MNIFESLHAELLKYLPKLKIAYKDKSWFMKALAKLLFFVPSFLTAFTTTIGYTIYFTSEGAVKENLEGYSQVLSHEATHAWDRKRYGFLFFLSYLFPQCLAALVLLSFLAIWFTKLWLLSLLFLVFLAPIPAYFRMRWELRGYTMNYCWGHWMNGYDPNCSFSIDRFSGPSYYFMWPFRQNMIDRFNSNFVKLQDGSILEEQPYKIIHDFIVGWKADHPPLTL